MENINRVIQGAGVHHIALQARDWERSRYFYETVLGMPHLTTFEAPSEKFTFFDIGNGSYIKLFYPNAATPIPGNPSANDPVTNFAPTTTNLCEVVERVQTAKALNCFR